MLQKTWSLGDCESPRIGSGECYRGSYTRLTVERMAGFLFMRSFDKKQMPHIIVCVEILLQNLLNLYQAIGDCLARGQQLPTLILLYAGLDIVASVEANNEGTKKSFTRWVDSYLLPAKPLGCTALELYAARCGMVHTLTAESDLSRSGKARAIYYAWGSGDANDLSNLVSVTGRQDQITVVHVGQLREAFLIAVQNWADEVRRDSQRLKHVESQGRKWFVNIDPTKVKAFLSGRV